MLKANINGDISRIKLQFFWYPFTMVKTITTNQERIKGTEKASAIHTLFHHRSQGGLDNSQSHSANVFRVDDPRSEPRVLHELRQKKMAEDAESNIAIRFVDEKD